LLIKKSQWAGIAVIAAALTIGLAIAPEAAFAYVGPGAGVSLFGAAVGMLVAIFSAIGVILWWPIKVLIRRIKGTSAKTAATQSEAAEKSPTA
jgi:hypothetical protein